MVFTVCSPTRERLTLLLTSERSASSILHLSLRTESPNIAVVQQIPPKLVILTTKICISIRNQEPRDQGTTHSECRPDQKSPLQCLTLRRERFLDRDEDLCADGSARFADRGREAEEMATKRSRERLGAAEESGDLSRSVSEWKIATAHKKAVYSHQGPSHPAR